MISYKLLDGTIPVDGILYPGSHRKEEELAAALKKEEVTEEDCLGALSPTYLE